MNVAIYLDESGDCGWIFDKPHLKGGSSRYLTLAAVIVPETKTYVINRVVKQIYKNRRRSLKSEIKSTELSKVEREQFVKDVQIIKAKHPEIEFVAITVYKEHVYASIRKDPNGFYNYVMKLLLLDDLLKYRSIALVPDARSVKTSFKHSLHNYLHQSLIEKVAESSFETFMPILSTTPLESKRHLEIQFADILASLFWAKYEYKNDVVNPLLHICRHKPLFFPKAYHYESI